MVKEGVLDNPKVDVIFGLHIKSDLEVGKIGYRPGGTMAASSDFKITVKGKPSHGATPWKSVDPIVVSAQIINSLQTIVSRNVNLTENAAVVTVGSIQGGNRSNIIPGEVEMIGTVRTLSENDGKLIYSRIHQIAEKTAEANDATATVELPYTDFTPVLFNDPSLTQKMLPSLQTSVGENNVKLYPAATYAEDFAYYSKEIPALYFFIGGMPLGQDPNTAPPHHTQSFFIDESGFKTGVKAMCNLVFDYMKMSEK